MNNHNNLLLNIQQTVKEILTESSLPIKLLFTFSSIFYPVSLLFPSLLNFLSITPATVLPPKFWLWTLLTYPFFEVNLLNLIFGLFMITVASKLLEPLWGYKEFLKFIVISWVSSGVLSAASYLVVYSLTFNENLLYGRQFYGLGAVCGAICVGLKQTRGEDFILKTPWLREAFWESDFEKLEPKFRVFGTQNLTSLLLRSPNQRCAIYHFIVFLGLFNFTQFIFLSVLYFTNHRNVLLLAIPSIFPKTSTRSRRYGGPFYSRQIFSSAPQPICQSGFLFLLAIGNSIRLMQKSDWK